MSCECRFDLYSMKLKAFSSSYDVESYTLPCSEAAVFLKQLDPAYHADKYPMHKVRYKIINNGHIYTSKLTDTPAKAAAKIELFMKDPAFLPKSD